ncbi:MAG: class I SAM-dependent methyltransferase [Patescibacteria group bacterium]
MTSRNQKWWEDFWLKHNEGYGAPNEKLLGFASDFIKGRQGLTAVDIASGDGRYAIPLAKMGYIVDAIEYAETGVQRIKDNALKAGVEINTFQADFIQQAKGKKQYDLVLSSGLLEEIDQKYHKEVVEGFMNWTKPQGLNIIKFCLWIKGRGYLTQRNLVKPLYEKAGWKIMFFDTPTEIQQSKANIKFDDKIESKIMTETVVASKP